METIPFPIHKRIFDLFITSFLAVLLLPVFLLILIAMTIEFIFVPSSRGPIFYKETRLSAGEPFLLYKFRIFKVSSLNRFKFEGDVIQTKDLENSKNNLTVVGNILKQIYMDELPQLWCVLNGSMTLVGPRPTNTKVMEDLKMKGCKSKFIFKAGITGFFQSHKGLKIDMDQELSDMEYIRKVIEYSWWKMVAYDLKILLITILTVFRAEGI